ncbi:MAG: CopG family transcriptional regulator [Pelodictyon phaeoclathratiforme]|nr:CopG family transcriptional regulator [Pelodictyon phaeoclathratiforme]
MMTTKTKRQQVTFKIPKETNDRLTALAVATRRTKTFVLEEAVSAYLNYNEWQIQSIQRGLEDMKAGRVTPIEDVIAELEAELENCPD